MRTSLKRIIAGTLLTMVVCSQTAFAASNASEATTGSSTGSSDMTVGIPTLVKITKVDDIFVGSSPDYNGSDATLTDNDAVCVYSNMWSSNGTPTYSVTLKGSGAGDAFTLACTSGNCNGDTIAYTAEWNDGTGYESVTAGSAKTGRTGWSNNIDCSGSTNANFRVTFTKNELLNNAYAGDYSGTLTIVITPSP